MTARILKFPERGPFVVRVRPNEDGWLVICRVHGWLHGDQHEAIADAEFVAGTFGVAVEVKL